MLRNYNQNQSSVPLVLSRLVGCNMQPDVNSYLRENSKKPSLSTILTVASSDNDSNNENFNVSKVL